LAGVNTSINNLKCREGKDKWKTTRKAVSAAEQKVVESTATQVKDQEFHVLVHVALKEFSDRTAKEEALVVTDHAEALAKAQREASVTDHAEVSVKVLREASVTDQEETLERVQKEEALVVTDHAEALAKAQTVQEDHSKEEATAVSETLARRASLREISTTSVTRTRAESTR
jgi:hypothetical protein